MRNLKKVSQLFRIVEAKQVCHGSDHEHLESDRIVWAKLVMGSSTANRGLHTIVQSGA
jgi:hypothetical protein